MGSEHRGYASRLVSSVGHLWSETIPLRLKHIRRESLRTMAVFPLSILFFCALFYTAEPEFKVFRLGSVAVSGLCFCGGCMLGVFVPERRLQMIFRLALLVVVTTWIATLFLPVGSARATARCLCLLADGVVAVVSFFLFSTKLNNAERFAALMPICLSLNWGYWVGGAGAWLPGIWRDGIILAAGLSLLALGLPLRYESGSEPGADVQCPRVAGSYWFLLYAIFFIAITWLASEYIVATNSIFRMEKIYAGLLIIAIALIIQGVFRRSMWHMWNVVLLLAVAGMILLWLPGSISQTLGPFLLDMMMTLFIYALFAMLSGIIKRCGRYRFFRRFMLILYIGMVSTAAASGALSAIWPGDTLLILTVFIGAAFVAILLLSPVISQQLFMPRWIEDFRGVDICSDEVAEEAPAPKPVDRLEASNLTPREKQVAALLLEGLTMRQIAPEMDIAFSTVGTYCKSIYRKLGINSRSELFLWFNETPPPMDETDPSAPA